MPWDGYEGVLGSVGRDSVCTRTRGGARFRFAGWVCWLMGEALATAWIFGM